MAVYNVSDNLYEYLKRCPKTHKKYQGYYTITKWADIDEKNEENLVKELKDLIADYSSYWQINYKNNLVNDIKDKTVDEHHSENTLNQIDKGIKETENEVVTFMLGNEKRYWENYYNGRKNLSFSERVHFIFRDNHVSSLECNGNKYFVIFPKGEKEPDILFKRKNVVIENLPIKMGDEQTALYQLFYNHIQEGLTTEDIIEKYPDELSEILTKIKGETQTFSFGGNPFRKITNLINAVNHSLIKNNVKPDYCIKLKQEKKRGNGYNIAIYEINRKSIS